MIRRRSRLAPVAVAFAAPVLAALVSCSGPQADPVDLSSRTPEPSGTTGPPTAPTYAPSLAPGTVLPTVGTPTTALAELRGAQQAEPGVVRAWTAYQEALSESLRAHRPTAELRSSAGPKVVQMVQARGPGDASDGLTVSLRPLGRLQSIRVSEATATMRTCMWAPSVGFFVEADGQEFEGGEPGWVEYATTLTRTGERWVVVEDGRTGRGCPGKAP